MSHANATLTPAGRLRLAKLVVEQLSGRWKIKHEDMRRLALQGRDLVGEIREAGAKVRLIGDGDVAGAVAAAQDDLTNSVDIMMGIGGTPEGVITAAAMKCMGGEIQGKLWPKDDAERQKAIDAGHDLDRVLTTSDLVNSEHCYFVATGVTNGDMVRGVSYRQNSAITRSLVMRSKSGTIRHIESVHQLNKLQEYSVLDYTR